MKGPRRKRKIKDLGKKADTAEGDGLALNSEFRCGHGLADFIRDVNRRGRKWHLHPMCEQTRTRILSLTTDKVLCHIMYPGSETQMPGELVRLLLYLACQLVNRRITNEVRPRVHGLWRHPCLGM